MGVHHVSGLYTHLRRGLLARLQFIHTFIDPTASLIPTIDCDSVIFSRVKTVLGRGMASAPVRATAAGGTFCLEVAEADLVFLLKSDGSHNTGEEPAPPL
jgi:hypothetical protein